MISSISQLIALVESNGDINALRFEPAYHPDKRAYPLIRQFHPGLSLVTYDTILATSWGHYQIMGDNLYMLGLRSPILDYWKDADLQAVFFNRFCVQRNISYTLDEVLNNAEKRADFAHHYNGGGNIPGYSARLLSVYEENK